MRKGRIIFGLLLGIFLVFIFINKADAIPTFARKYRTSCTTCHIGFNKLNPFGDAYRQNGFQVPEGDAAYVKEEPLSLGAPAWKKVWPEAVWPGAIPGFAPLSFMVHQRAIWNQEDEEGSINFDFPHEWEMFVGGDLGDWMSFYGEFVLYEDGQVEGAERLFAQFNDLLTGNIGWLPENALNIKVGHFDIAADPFPNPIKRTLTRYLMSDYTVGSSSFRLRNRQSGIETNGLVFRRLKYAAGVVNGNSARGLDNNEKKDFYYRAVYKLGGMALDGSGGELGEELVQTDNWAEKSMVLGTFGYLGAEELTNPITSTTYNNKFGRFGGDAQIRFGNLELLGGMLLGYNSKAHGSTNSIETIGWLAEGDYVIFPWLITALRYEGLRRSHDSDNVSRFIPSVSIYPRANTRFIVEYIFYPDDQDGDDRLLIDFAYLF